MPSTTTDTPRVWVCRAGKRGEDEEACLRDNLAIIGFRDVTDLSRFVTFDALLQELRRVDPENREKRAENRARQLRAFRDTIQDGDIIVLPLKTRSGQIAVGKASGAYRYAVVDGEKRHVRSVKWLRPDVPRSVFQQDLLHSFGAFLTVCEVTRHEASRRVAGVLEGKPDPGYDDREEGVSTEGSDTVTVPVAELPNVEEAALDQIRSFIRDRFRDHAMAGLVAAVLRAEGYVTEVSPPGADGGADILAGRGPLGLDAPFLCVQVKATEAAADVKLLRELSGTMDAFKATHGLLVCWGGYTRAAEREARAQSYKIRLWGQDELLKALLSNYDRLSEEVKAELPFKRVWVLVREEEEA